MQTHDNHILIIAGRRKQVLDHTTQANPGMASYVVDLQDPAAAREFAVRISRDFPALNVLVNNSGIMRAENLLAQPEDLADMEAIVATDLMNGAADPRAMPLGAYIAEVMHLIRTQPEATEICVETVKRLRFAAETGKYEDLFQGFNDAMAQDRP